MNIEDDTSLCTLDTNNFENTNDPFLFMISIPQDIKDALSTSPNEPSGKDVDLSNTAFKNISQVDNHTQLQHAQYTPDSNVRVDTDVVVEGECILFVMQRLLFSRRPRHSFKHVLNQAFKEYQQKYLFDDTEFNIDIHEPVNSKIPFDFFTTVMQTNEYMLEPIQGNLRKIIDCLQERTKTGNYIVFCTLNSEYTHPCNKKLEKNPHVTDHCVIFRNGYILCNYLCRLKDPKLSITKHIKVISNDFNTNNTSPTSYVSKIKAMFKVIKL